MRSNSVIRTCLLCLFAFGLLSIASLAGELKSEKVPSDKAIISNIDHLFRAIYGNRGPGKRVNRVLGVHHRPSENVYVVHYSFDLRSREEAKGTPDSETQSNIVIYKLNTNLWIMKMADRKDWILMQD